MPENLLKIKRLLPGDTVPVQLDGDHELKMQKMEEGGYRIKFSTQYVVVKDSELNQAVLDRYFNATEKDKQK